MDESHLKGDDLPTSAGATSAGGQSPPSAPQMSIGKVGRYKLTRLLGEGGMGSVYEAEQDQPRRTVALKVIKPGLANPEMLRRFAQESQALGRLQHPGIAQIYDAGTADTGYGPQPYFAMEYIQGTTLREYAETHHLNTRQRLEIVAKICDAVHHAHQRGLIHRDLKPGNILVDETGQPKILDFGVARVTDSDAQATMQTDVGQLVGTLAYMSPEQVLADPLEIDTRSDVYALGVILYELLAGRLPYNISKKLHEALHTIREEDPSKLSSISRTYRGDIETIASKALEKDKARRYASAAELAADITHYLKDEPILAQPPTTRYQLQKFARRHKAIVAGIAAVFVVLMGGVIVSTWQAVRASRAETAALRDRDRATTAERTATVARDEALDAKGLAVAAEGQAKLERDKAVAEKERADTESATAKAVGEFLQKNLFEQVTGGAQRGAGPDLSISGALDRAAARIDGAFDTQPLVEAGVREAIASSYVSLSNFDKAALHAERALALRRRAQGEEDKDVLKAMRLVAAVYSNQRKFGESEKLLAKALEVHRRNFGRDHADTLKWSRDLALIYLADEKAEKAEPLGLEAAEGRRRTLGPGHRDTIDTAILLASIYETRQKFPEASKWAGTAYESSRRALGENDASTLAARTLVQRVNLKMTRNAPVDRTARNEMLENAARTLDSTTAKSLPEMITLAANRATVAVNQGRPEEAEAPLLEALEAARRAGQEELSLTAILAGVYALQKKFAEAETTIQKVLAKPAAWKDLTPNVLPFALRSLGTGFRNERRFAEAEPYFSKLVPLVIASPGEGAQQTRIDMFLAADNHASAGHFADSERMFSQLLEVQRRLAGPETINTLVTLSNLGWVRLQQKRYSDAEGTFREAAAILNRTAPDSWERYNVESMLGASVSAQRKFEQAEPLLISGYEGMQPRKPSSTATNASRFTLDQAGEAIAQHYGDWGKLEKQSEWTAKIRDAKNAPKP
jgi:eukaryotic-like serine/threonine-protein kinase